MHGGPGREIGRQLAPLAARSQQVEQSIEHRAHAGRARAAARSPQAGCAARPEPIDRHRDPKDIALPAFHVLVVIHLRNTPDLKNHRGDLRTRFLRVQRCICHPAHDPGQLTSQTPGRSAPIHRPLARGPTPRGEFAGEGCHYVVAADLVMVTRSVQPSAMRMARYITGTSTSCSIGVGEAGDQAPAQPDHLIGSA